MINHPIVKKEWKILKWMMLLFGCIFAFSAILLNQNMAQRKVYHLIGEYQEGIFMSQLYDITAGMVPILLIGLMVTVGVVFIYDRNSHIGKFISSLPYTRKEYFKIKYLMGMISFTVPLMVFGVVVYMIRRSHLGWISRIYQYSPYGELLKAQDGAGVLFLWLGLLWLIMLTTYSFLMMVQTLMGKNIVASIVGGIALLVPLFLGYAIPENLNLLSSGMMGYSENLGKWAQLFFLGRPEYKLVGKVLALAQYDFITHYTRSFWIYNYQGLPLYMVFLAVGIIITTVLGFYFIQHNDVEKNGEIVLYPWVGKLLVIGAMVCSLLLLPIVIVLFTGIESKNLTLITMGIGGIIGYLISTKAIEINRKHG